MNDSSVRIHELLEYIKNGKIMDAMNEFYADSVIMEEPAYGKTEGLQANLEREQKFVDSVAEFLNFQAPKIGTGDGCSFYENIMAWKTTDGQEINVEQVAVQQWEDGKIVYERFYYNT